MLDPQDSTAPADLYVPTSNLNPPPPVKSDQSRGKKSDRPTADRADRREIKFLSVMIDVNSAHVVRVEGQDATGARFELSVDEKNSLAKRGAHERLEDLVEEAFEAGIACVLGGDTEPVDVNESVEDAELRHQLLAPLIERSAVVKSWIERGALNRAVVNRLIEGSPN